MHIHLDWHDTGLWLDTNNVPIRLAWDNRELVGVMAASAPLNNTCWIRLIALDDSMPTRTILSRLWDNLRQELAGLQIHTVAILIINDWLSNYVSALGFTYGEDIVTLRRDGRYLPASPLDRWKIRPAEYEDLERMTAVDQAAFIEPWQLAYRDLHQAMRISASCSVALDRDEIIGYQLSTLYRKSGHLARLAVLPEYQGQGVGAALLDHLIRRFIRRGILSLTVNTQASNLRSQRLYARYSFRRNGYDLPVWMLSTTPGIFEE